MAPAAVPHTASAADQPATATATPAPAPPDVPEADYSGTFRPRDDSGLTASQQEALAAAQKEAADGGEEVIVDALTTETSTTRATPSGSVIYDASVLPTRVKQSGSWVPVDATLHRDGTGRWAPAASAEPVTFSDGGSGALVTMDSGKASLSLSWPDALPTPEVSGADVRYPSVLPGVDLRVTANTQGGFSEVLIVHTAEAAANPKLATLHFTTTAEGVDVADDGHGNLEATAPDGRVLFSAPQPLMWDSSTTAQTKSTSRPSVTAATDAVQPGVGAQVAPVDAQIEGNTLSLTPDPELLKGEDTSYPVFIDPTWNPHYASGSKQHYAEVQQGCPSAKNYDSTQYGDPGVGYNSWSGCIGLERSYFQLGFPSTAWSSHIVSATVNVRENYSASCSLSGDVALYWSGAISSGTTWSSRPSLSGKLATRSFGPACDSQPSGGFSVTSTIAKGAAAHWKSWTFALINAHEGSGDGAYFKRFASNPSMSITYNHIPSAPGALSTKVGSKSLGCGTAAPYPIVGKTLASTPPTLNATVSDGDKDALAATYAYWVGSGSATTTTSATVSSGSSAPKQLSSSFMSGLKDGSVVSWRATASDGKDTSSTSSTCHFTVDLQTPPRPTSPPPTASTPKTVRARPPPAPPASSPCPSTPAAPETTPPSSSTDWMPARPPPQPPPLRPSPPAATRPPSPSAPSPRAPTPSTPMPSTAPATSPARHSTSSPPWDTPHAATRASPRPSTTPPSPTTPSPPPETPTATAPPSPSKTSRPRAGSPAASSPWTAPPSPCPTSAPPAGTTSWPPTRPSP